MSVRAELNQSSKLNIRRSYSLRLLELLYEDHLLERESFLRFLVAQVDGSNIAQLPFVLFLVEEYLGEFLLTEPLSARLVAACFGRSTEVSLTYHNVCPPLF